MKKLALLTFSVALLLSAAVAHPASGQTPPPPPPGGPAGGGPPPPPPPPGSTNTPTPAPPTSTPTPTPTPTATSTPTATPTSTPIPCFASVKLSHSTVKSGQKQKITISTLPSATVKLVIKYPNKSKKTVHKTANTNGTATYQFKQPSGKATAKSQTAQIAINVTCSGQAPISKKKKYKIH